MRLAYDALAWLCLALIVVGLGGGMLMTAYVQWVGGLDAGAPFSFLAGLQFLGFIADAPALLLLFLIGGIGAGGLAVVAPHSRYAAKKGGGR